ncbi:MAG: AlbA family DNA-binding domain-containing protein [Nitrososphaera sp.]
MISRPFDAIAFEDITALKDGLVPESRTLEYKLDLPNDADSGRIPFLAEVCAFANTSGGDIVFGIYEEGGVPADLKGLEVVDRDSSLLKFEQIIRTGLEPILQNVRLKFVPGQQNKSFLVVRVPRSWNGPHRVSYKDHSKFYGRNSAGKYPMDVSELRTAFLNAESVSTSARNFRKERVARIKNNVDLPMQVERNGFLVLHLVPFIALDGVARIDVAALRKNAVVLPPIGASGWNQRLNLDGIVFFSGERHGSSDAYTQVFRNGFIEAASSFIASEGSVLIPSEAYEKDCIQACGQYFAFLKSADIPIPIAAFVSLLGIRAHQFAVSRKMFWSTSTYPLDRDDLLLPELLADSYDINPATFLRPAFDMVWQSFGFDRSFNYDEGGKWVGQRE